MAPKKPPLSVVTSLPNGDEPASTHGGKLWRTIQARHRFTAPGDVELLRQACIMTDRAEMLAGQIESDGATFSVGHIPKSHPALKDELAARAFVTRTLMRLGVVTGPEKKANGRPGGEMCGLTGEQMRLLGIGTPDDDSDDGDDAAPA